MRLDYSNVLNFISEEEIKSSYPSAKEAMSNLVNKTSKGSDYLGWVDLPNSISEEDISEIEHSVNKMRATVDIVVVVGIGGSYLGAKAVIDLLSPSFIGCKHGGVEVLFAGHNISEDYLYELMTYLENKEFGLCVISKSGTTTEPALAFRLLKELLERNYDSKEISKRVIAITDAKKGALKNMAEKEGYKTFVIPDNVGGRYSVLTPVGLIPIALAGYDIRELVKGAQDISNKLLNDDENDALKYATIRNLLYNKGFHVEILANFHPKLHFITEWWKQLFGESEGKEGKGIFPTGVDLTTDLHSMGQYIQEGRRMLMETVLSVETSEYELRIPNDKENLDELNYLSGKRVDEVNKMAELGTRMAHLDGGVPNMLIRIPRLTPYHIGELFYFFELSCGISGQLLGVNPFNQPGVEAYKSNMFRLLDKPGYNK